MLLIRNTGGDRKPCLPDTDIETARAGEQGK
jgi:hypothetical protein